MSRINQPHVPFAGITLHSSSLSLSTPLFRVCLIMFPMCPFVCAILPPLWRSRCINKVTYIYTQNHEYTSPTLMTERSCVDFICLYNRGNSLEGLRPRHTSTTTAQSHTLCMACVCVCLFVRGMTTLQGFWMSLHNSAPVNIPSSRRCRTHTHRASSRNTIIMANYNLYYLVHCFVFLLGISIFV